MVLVQVDSVKYIIKYQTTKTLNNILRDFTKKRTYIIKIG